MAACWVILLLVVVVQSVLGEPAVDRTFFSWFGGSNEKQPSTLALVPSSHQQIYPPNGGGVSPGGGTGCPFANAWPALQLHYQLPSPPTPFALTPPPPAASVPTTTTTTTTTTTNPPTTTYVPPQPPANLVRCPLVGISPAAMAGPMLIPQRPSGDYQEEPTGWSSSGPGSWSGPGGFRGPPCNILQLLDHPELSQVRSLVRQAALEDMFASPGNMTFLAPVDSAFLKLPRTVMATLQSSLSMSRALLLSHMIPGIVSLNNLYNEQLLTTSRPGSPPVRVNVYRLAGSEPVSLTLNGVRVILAEVKGSNGQLYLLEDVVPTMPSKTIADHLADATLFGGFSTAVLAADLQGLLQGRSPLTLFAPTPQAFEAFRIGNSDVLLGNTTAVQEFVYYHLVAGTHHSSGLMDGALLPSLLNGTEMRCHVTIDGFSRRLARVNGNILVVKGDILALNGVIHIVDKVLDPAPEALLRGLPTYW